MISTRTRRSGSAVRGPLLAGLVVSSLTTAAFPVLAQQAQDAPDYPHAYPREGVTKQFENERVVIWEVVWPDGVPAEYHRHRYDMTGVFLRWGPLRVTRTDGTFTVSETPFEVPSTFLLRKGVTHKEEGIGQPERHSFMIDMKDYTPPPRAPRTDVPPAFPRDGATQKLDADRVASGTFSSPIARRTVMCGTLCMKAVRTAHGSTARTSGTGTPSVGSECRNGSGASGSMSNAYVGVTSGRTGIERAR